MTAPRFDFGDDDPIRRVGLRAWQRNRHRADQLTQLAAELAAQGFLGETDRARGERLSHQLVGSAGTFGHPAVQDPAHRLEMLFAELPLGAARTVGEITELAARITTVLTEEPMLDG